MTLYRSGCGCSAPCACARSGPAIDPATGAAPAVRVRFNDGALLDSDDLTIEQNAHLWRDRLHNVLLHGPGGVVWGLAVDVESGGRLLRVHPGAAVDARGRLLLLEEAVCLDLFQLPGAFVEGLKETERGRSAFVVLAFEACVDEPVTAVRPVCPEPGVGIYSRQIDGARVDLVAEAPPAPIVWLRRWLGREDLGILPAGDRARLVELLSGPAEDLHRIWEEDEPVPLLLAEVRLLPGADGLVAGGVDVTARPLMPPVQLLAEAVLGVDLAREPTPRPQVVRAVGVRVQGGALEVDLDRTLDPASLSAPAVALLAWESGAWSVVDASASASGTTLTVTPTTAPAAGTRMQLVLKGTGAHALLGAGGEPFTGDAAPSPLPRAADLTLVVTWS